jgi:isopenicillin-N N-acyltransferase-like protein
VTKPSNRVLPLVDISGPPDQRGHEYGEKAHDRIHRGISNYKAAFSKIGIDWVQACDIAGSFLPRIRRQEKTLFTEIEGIAKSAGLTVEEILALNCRTEIIYGQNGESNEATDGCTGAIALPDATASGHVLHAQNWDWRDECADSAIVLRISSGDGPDILTQTEAGVLARCGINSSGIALTGNFLKCERDNSPDGIPIPFVRRHILEQETLSDAMNVVLKSPKAFSTNLMISDAGGEAIDLEAVPGETFWVEPKDGLLVHANHFESARAVTVVTDKGILVTPCSLYRSSRVRSKLSKDVGKLETEHLKNVLADKYGSPYGICAEPVQDANGGVWSTVATIIFDVTERTMWVAVRPYGDHVYTQYGFINQGKCI